MINIGILETIIKLALWSAYVKGEKPLSLLIIAKAESGKSQLVMRFADNKGVILLTDATSYGITKEFTLAIETKQINHIIIPDLLTPLSRQKATVNHFIAFFNNLIEEGVIEIHTGVINIRKTGLNCGLITTITREELFDRRHRWNRIGFLSRLLPVSYEYSQKTAQEILDSIVKREYYKNDKIKLDFPKEPVEVDLPPTLAQRMVPYATRFGKAHGIYGFRMEKQLQTMLEAHALMYQRTKVDEGDVKAVEQLLQYVNLDFNKL